MKEKTDTQQQTLFKILLIGDKGLDVYTYGRIDRISPEAPVPVFVPQHQTSKPGMADNVRVNLEALGCTVNFIHGDTSNKERLIDERSKQQIVRIDHDRESVPLLINLKMLKGYDAIVISDYNKGSVTYDLIKIAIKSKLPVFIDTKKTDLQQMQGAWVKINDLEYTKIKSECSGLIVTKGSKGAVVPHHELSLPAPKVEVVDVTGAGDTFLSALTYMWLITKNIALSVEFANRAAAITVQHVGCYAPTLEEIK